MMFLANNPYFSDVKTKNKIFFSRQIVYLRIKLPELSQKITPNVPARPSRGS